MRIRADELSILNCLTRKINESQTVEDAIQFGLEEIVRAVGSDFAVFFLLTGEDLTLKGIFSGQSELMWRPGDVHKVGTCICGQAISENKAIYSVNIQSDPRRSRGECLNAGFCSFAALPLRSGSEILGVLGIASRQHRDFHAPQRRISIQPALSAFC